MLLLLFASCDTAGNEKGVRLEKLNEKTAIESQSKEVKDQAAKEESSEAVYDEDLAKKYGSDEYGMKKYVIAFLKKGPNRDIEKSKATELQRAHMENIGKMADAGKLVLAGPFLGDGDLRGLYIFNVPTIAEAEELTKSDPAIKAGSLVMELKEWYGSGAVMAVNELHNKITKTSH